MEQTTFKTVTFGGFDKEDVVTYIQKMATEAAQAQQQLTQQLQTMEAELQAKDADLHAKEEELAEKEAQWTQDMDAMRQELQGQIDAISPDAQAYQRFCQNMAALELEAHARANDLETEALAKLEAKETEQASKLEAMEAQVLQRLHEQEAQSAAKLAEEEAKSQTLLAETMAVLQREVGHIAKHYNQMATDFANNAMAISAQLRSMDVSVLHMPQALDQVGHQLKALEHGLQDGEDNCVQVETE